MACDLFFFVVKESFQRLFRLALDKERSRQALSKGGDVYCMSMLIPPS
jgi:hypothetical protein